MAFHDIEPFADRDGYYESYTGADRVEYSITPEQARLNELTVDFLSQHALQASTQAIADIGCSYGITLMSLRQRGHENLYAMDPDRSAIRYLSQQNINGRTGFATEDAPELEEKFDLILLRHVLEHLYSPLEAINNVAKWLKPSGRLYIELPDLSLFQRAAPFPGFFYEYEHINHFSLYSLLNLMRGFNLIQFESSSEIYPCIRALFEVASVEKNIFHSTVERQFVEQSLSQANPFGLTVLDNIAQLGDREIALWGVSTFVYRLLTHTPLKHCRIKHLVDRNPQLQGQKLLGLSIASPQSLSTFKGAIVICGMNSAQSIEQSIRDLGLDNPVIHLLHGAES